MNLNSFKFQTLRFYSGSPFSFFFYDFLLYDFLYFFSCFIHFFQLLPFAAKTNFFLPYSSYPKQTNQIITHIKYEKKKTKQSQYAKNIFFGKSTVSIITYLYITKHPKNTQRNPNVLIHHKRNLRLQHAMHF